MSKFIFLLLATLALADKKRLPVKPNIVVIFADDLGYGDLPKFGNTVYSTPNIDQLADEGMLLTSWYSASATCTPSRAALLTGQYPVRTGLVNMTAPTFLSPSQRGGINPSMLSLPTLLKTAGYRTGMAGKWHLGLNEADRFDSVHFPTKNGFDYATLVSPVGNNNVCKNTNQTANPNYPNFCMFLKNQASGAGVVFQKPWSTTNLPNRMLSAFESFLDCTQCSNPPVQKHAPFFWYHASIQTHTPLYADGKTNPTYADAVAELDTEVGLIVNELRTRGLDNTLVFFTSDNGPFLEDFVFENHDASTAGPFKGGKGQTWEGGFRVPGIAWFPGYVPAGTTRDEVVTTMDIFPTALRLAGVPLPVDRVIDGKDMTDLIFDRFGWGRNDAWKNDVFIYYCNTALFAARWKKYKLVYTSQNFLRLTNIASPTPGIAPTPPDQCGGECCPLTANSISLCPCENVYAFINAQFSLGFVPGPWTTTYAVPVLFDLEADVHEDNPLTPDNFPDYNEVFETINFKVENFKATLGNLPLSQINLPLVVPALAPVCPIPGTPPPTNCNLASF